MEKSPFQFSNPVLRTLRMQLNDGFSIPSGGSVPAETHFQSYVTPSQTEPTAVVSLKFQMGKSDNRFPFFLEAEMAAQFAWDTQASDATVKIWLSQNAPALLLSYLRPIVANTINATGMPPYNIPFMNFTAGRSIVEQHK